jgi:myo-inositol-1(or 4)-monophosphatase
MNTYYWMLNGGSLMTNWTEIHEHVQHWIREAGQRIKQSFSTTLHVQSKSNRNDLVTNIDRETEQYFIQRIRDTYPTHTILGEEGFGDDVNSLDGIVWIIDPIDGTMNFVHQQRNFAISIGIYEDGKGKLGYIYDVVHEELYWAQSGKGAFLNDQPLPPLEEGHVEDAVIALNATWVKPNKRIDHQLLIPLVQDVRGTRSYGSAAIEMAYVAAGRLDAYITMRLSPWDFAAGKIIVEELGGKMTKLNGEPLNLLEKSSVFVSKPGLHEKILTKYLHALK